MKILDEVYFNELKVIHLPCVKCCIWKRSDMQSLWAVNNFVIVRVVDVLTAFN